MRGIYKFVNKINKKIYIGQSTNLEERYKSHKRNYNNPNSSGFNTHFYNALRKYGFDNFDYEIIIQSESFSKEELNELEIYFIKKFDSFNSGYNMNIGGNFTSSKKKLDIEIVEKIKKDLKNNTDTLTSIGEKYGVSTGLISMINNGKIWNKENEKYPIRVTTSARKGETNGRAKITDEEVIKIRKMYVNNDLNTIYKLYSDRVSFSTMKKIVYGQQFKHLPIYKKREKKWILNQSCIDYPLGWNAGE